MSRILGIDLGTSNTVVAVCIDQVPTIIPNAEGERSTPSVVGIDATTGRVIVGAPAKRQAALNPRGTIFSVKRIMGRTYDQVEPDLRYLPYEVVRAPGGDAHIRVGEKIFTPADISAHILRKAKEDAETYLREEVTQAVITVPAYFNDRQRKATQVAGQRAGLTVSRIINEPTAAALAYCLARARSDGRIAVVHLGGGTLDVSILEVEEGVFEVKSVCGDTKLGGDDFDKCIIDWAYEEMQRVYGVAPSKDLTLAEMLRWEAERAKCDLSTQDTAEMLLPYVRLRPSSAYSTVSLSIDRSVFETRAISLIERISGPCKSALRDAGLSSVDHVILVGQQTKMPAVQLAVANTFARTPRRDVDPAEVVALGAAIQADALHKKRADVLLIDVIPLSVGIETLGGVFTPLIGRNSTIPSGHQSTFTTTADNQPEVKVRVFQGERPMARDNTWIGEITLAGIPPAPKGEPKIKVTFDIDADGVLLVSAKDLSSGSEQSISIGGALAGGAHPIDGWNPQQEVNAPSSRSGQPIHDMHDETPSIVGWVKKLFGRKSEEESAEQ